jgi:hypothetical protein
VTRENGERNGKLRDEMDVTWSMIRNAENRVMIWYGYNEGLKEETLPRNPLYGSPRKREGGARSTYKH